MIDSSLSISRGINVTTVAGSSGGDSANEVAALMKRIAQLQKDIKKRINDNSGDPKQKLEQLKLMQAELTLMNQSLTRLLAEQARQGKRQEGKTSGAEVAQESAPDGGTNKAALKIKPMPVPASRTSSIPAGNATATATGTIKSSSNTSASTSTPTIDTYA